MKPIKTLNSNIVYKNSYCRVRKDLVEHPTGFKSHYHVIERNNFAVAIPLTEKNETYMVRQFRYPVKKFSLEFPMGGIDVGESKREAARRELLEETGIEAGKFSFLGSANPALGSLSNEAFCYLATEIVRIGKPSPDETECLEIVKIKVEEIDVLIKKGEIVDGPTIFAKHLLDIFLRN